MSTSKALLFGVQSVMKPARVKTAASFTANDPWNQNRPTTFKLEEYLQMMKDTPLPETTKATATDFRRALVSEIDGVQHWLPDSLSELWRRKLVASEALPRLLSEAEPTLKGSDYTVFLRNKALWITIAVRTLICAGVVVATIIGLANADGSLLPKIGAVVLVAGLLWAILYFAHFRKWFGRKRQMKWFLERARGNAPETMARTTPAGTIGAELK
jgi:hypothetical protein